jgi:hypothetical protein
MICKDCGSAMESFYGAAWLCSRCPHRCDRCQALTFYPAEAITLRLEDGDLVVVCPDCFTEADFTHNGYCYNYELLGKMDEFKRVIDTSWCA